MTDIISERSRLAQYLNQPLKIGEKIIPKRLVLAPMAQLGHMPFRILAASFGGFGLLFSEMCSAKKVPTENRTSSPYFKINNEEQDYLVIQIYGSDKDEMAKAAMRIESEGVFGVDINFGCSASRILKQQCGAALLKHPAVAAGIVEKVKKSIEIPLFVKFRIGWEKRPEDVIDMAKRFEDAGADALTFHPRVPTDRRNRPPMWYYIEHIKKNVSIPVFGNGNVFTDKDCLSMIGSTGCDGVSLGRIAIAKPWIFSMWTNGFKPSDDIYLNSANRLATLLTHHFEPQTALRRFKKFILYYSANFKFGHTLLKTVSSAKSIEVAIAAANEFLSRPLEVQSRPNLNFFL